LWRPEGSVGREHGDYGTSGTARSRGCWTAVASMEAGIGTGSGNGPNRLVTAPTRRRKPVHCRRQCPGSEQQQQCYPAPGACCGDCLRSSHALCHSTARFKHEMVTLPCQATPLDRIEPGWGSKGVREQALRASQRLCRRPSDRDAGHPRPEAHRFQTSSCRSRTGRRSR
jgi:hypothetical protein